MPLDAFLTHAVFTAADRRLFLDDRSESASLATATPKKLILLIGPEGGFSDAERTKLLTAKVSPCLLGPRILRAETAVVVGLTAVQLKWGDLAPPPR
jgi:16S rRNA (uracil1498-N3)-methyltransferase